jgi:hypothetical protein
MFSWQYRSLRTKPPRLLPIVWNRSDLIQINGVAVIAVAQARGKDL